MMHDFYYRGPNEEELIIQQSHNEKLPVSIRVCEAFGSSAGYDDMNALVLLPEEEIDRMITALQEIKKKIVAERR